MKQHLLAILPALLLINPTTTAHASGCPSTELVFARGTNEAPGLGEVGESFQATLHAQSVYAVDFPASMDFGPSTLAGVADAAHHIESMASRCGRTRIVLAGYSAGAAVASFVTSDAVPPGVDTDLRPLTDAEASHVAAVVLFGAPSPNFSGLLGVPQSEIGGRFQNRVRAYCVDGDPVCSSGGDFSLHCTYSTNGMTVDAATFARNHL